MSEIENMRRAIEQARRDGEELDAELERIRQRAEILKQVAEHARTAQHQRELAFIQSRRTLEGIMLTDILVKMARLRRSLRRASIVRIH